MAATYVTKAGLEKLQQQLKDLTEHKRRLSAEVGRARELGDLRENAEYHAARERLGQILDKIAVLQEQLQHVEVVDPSKLQKGIAIIGTRVTVKDLSSSQEETYELVGAEESDPAAGKISVLSPLGKAFLGHKVNEKVTAALPGGAFSYQILSIESVG